MTTVSMSEGKEFDNLGLSGSRADTGCAPVQGLRMVIKIMGGRRSDKGSGQNRFRWMEVHMYKHRPKFGESKSHKKKKNQQKRLPASS